MRSNLKKLHFLIKLNNLLGMIIKLYFLKIKKNNNTNSIPDIIIKKVKPFCKKKNNRNQYVQTDKLKDLS